MKKKLFLFLALTVLAVLMLAVSVSAADYDTTRKVTIGDTEYALYDADGYALTYYKDSEGNVISARTVDLVNVNSSGWLQYKDNTMKANAVIANFQDSHYSSVFANEITGFDIKFYTGSYNTFNETLVYCYMPDEVTKVNGNNTFTNCSNLKLCEFTENSQMTTMCQYMFHQCSSLESFYFPAGVTEIPKGEGMSYGFFYKCTALSDVTFGSNENMTKIGITAFRYCTALEYITIPDSVTYVDTNAFRESGLKATPFSENSKLTTMGEHVFYKCASLVTAFIPKNVTEFHNCTSNDGGLFDRCTSLTTVTFHPESEFESFGGRCFYGCSALVNFEFPSTTTFIGQYSFNNAAFTSITVPHGVKTIERYAFQSCSNVTEIRLSPEFTRANKSAFYKTGTKYVYIPATVSYFEQHCFGTAEGGMGTNDMVFFYCGTQENFAGITFESNNQRITGATLINWGYDASGNKINNPTDDYYKTLATSEKKCYVVCNYNPCAAFYEGNHTGEESVKFADGMFVSNATLCVVCDRCKNTEEIETVAPLFHFNGFSYEEGTGSGKVMQAFAINKSVLDFYTEKFGAISYGLVAAVNTYYVDETPNTLHDGTLFDVTDGALVAREKVAYVDFTERDYEIFEIAISGLAGNNQNTSVYLCAYAFIDGKVYYLNDASVNEGTAGSSFTIADIKAKVDA